MGGVASPRRLRHHPGTARHADPFRLPKRQIATIVSSLISYLSSLAILVLGLAGGLWTLGVPRLKAPSPDLIVHSFEPPPSQAPLPVLRWYSEKEIKRVGRARPLEEGGFALEFYAQETAPQPSEAAVLLPASVSSLWALRSPGMEQRLREAMKNFAANVRPPLERILSSQAFREDYAPILRDILTDTLDAVWKKPATQRAAQAAFENFRRIMTDEVFKPAQPILLERTGEALRESFTSRPGRFVAELLGGSLDPEAIAIALERTLKDPEIASRFQSALDDLLESPESEQLAVTFSRAFLGEMMEREDAFELTQRLLADRRFSEDLSELRAQGLMEMRRAGEVLLALGGSEGLHPLAALTIRAFLQRDPPYFVLLVPEKLGQELTGVEWPAGQLLERHESAE